LRESTDDTHSYPPKIFIDTLEYLWQNYESLLSEHLDTDINEKGI